MTERPSVFRHKKRGTTYTIIGAADLQCAEPVSEGVQLTVYRCRETGKLWARPTAEFFDGRFVLVPPANAEPAP